MVVIGGLIAIGCADVLNVCGVLFFMLSFVGSESCALMAFWSMYSSQTFRLFYHSTIIKHGNRS